MFLQNESMRSLIFTHFLLNIYILAILQPALPVVEYLVNYDFIKKELCENKDRPILACNGKCYLDNQIKQLELPARNQDLPTPPKIDMEKLIVIVNENYSCNYLKEISDQKRLFGYRELVGYVSPTSLFRPPRS